ncbi:YfjI family protein [Kribbella sp. NPDC048928]|uniref:YfjI family protein n=1 Tax=Kribbella sp. NPDC048928 TaxID=3364111 RepID=UPI003717CCC6
MSAAQVPDWLPPLPPITEPPDDDPWATEPAVPAAPIQLRTPTETQITPRHPDRTAGPGTPADQSGTPWDGDPVPLKTDRLVRPFPVAVFPEWLSEQVTAVAEATQTPVDLAASVALACLSTAAGGKVLVRVDRSWVEQVNLYAVTALPPGSRKSPVFRAMTAPLSAAEEALRDRAGERRVEAELASRVAWARAEQLAKKAETAQAEPQTALADATAAAKEAAEIGVPELPRLMTDDVTPESCISLLATHGGRIAVLSAEGDVFATLTGTRYSAAPNLGVFLKGHAGDKLQVDRKGRASETVDRPALTLGVTTQPGTLAGLAAQPGFRDRGVLARILYSLPVNTVGQRDNQAEPVPEDTETTYTDALTTLVLLLADHDTHHEIRLTDEARQVLLEFQDWIEPRLDPRTGQLALITDWASKLAGAVVRLAGLLHVAHTFTTGYATPITADTIRAAEQIGRYYLDHALAVYDLMGRSDPDLDDARALLDWIRKQGHDTFSRRDALRGNRSRFPTAKDLTPALELLTDHGHIRPRSTPINSNGGRRTDAYEVHPAAHDNH